MIQPINIESYANIDAHLAKKIANHGWMEQCLKGWPSYFPYRVVEGGRATFEDYDYLPGEDHTKLPGTIGRNGKPAYVINIPMGGKRLFNDRNHLNRLIGLFKEQAFSDSPDKSKRRIQKRAAIVIGINQPKSLDPSVNNRFLDMIGALEPIKGVAYRVFGFFWKPELELVNSTISHTYTAEKSFLIIKALSIGAARGVREIVEGATRLNENLIGQIPFQRIRERIKSNSATREFVLHFKDNAPHSPLYYGVMDDDCLALRSSDGVDGLLSNIDAIVEANNAPSAITCGYQVHKGEKPLIRLGVKLDMRVREAMNRVIPYSTYLPEPASFFKIRAGAPDSPSRLREMSFVGNRPDEKKLESRRFTQSGRRSGSLGNDVIFQAEGGVVTTTPPRMHTIKKESLDQLTLKTLKEKQYLQSLRGVAQTHATPKQWADNLYVGLGFSSGQVTNVTEPMMHIFSVYDPLSRMMDLNDRFTNKTYDKVMNAFNDPLTEGHRNRLRVAKETLQRLKMPDEMVTRIELAAKRSGEAIYAVLREAEAELA